MRSAIKKFMFIILCVSLLICTWWGLGVSSVQIQAAPPPRPSVTPRPTFTPTPIKKIPEAPKSPVAILILHVQPIQDGLWAVIQWQDTQGGWHDVESWRGTVVNGKTIWWVKQKDFGKGPFRWLVFTQQSGNLWTISQSFRLPNLNQSPLEVNVFLPR